ncbi:hypothetical protein [Oceanobacter mangrovi]|uniref:hypothetical protein n=1 Tax=Oceanobacter mangrovi TaxID=2862510 RepID=UPI001C8CF568|nr:hypothetical protein [Oceanobacter mangrovi]
MLSYEWMFGIVGIVLTLVGFYPYVRGIATGKVKPHLFSWLIWAMTTLVVFVAQLQSGGGAGAWTMGVSGSITLGIAVVAWLRHSDISISRSDWLFLLAALSSLPLWYLSSDPLWAVVLLTLVDLAGFVPTGRKVWSRPDSESLAFYSLFAVRNLVSVLALEVVSVATALFPLAMTLACVLLMLIMVLRRRQLSRLSCLSPALRQG